MGLDCFLIGSYRGFHNDILFYVLLDLVARRVPTGMVWANGVASVEVATVDGEEIVASAERVAALYVGLGANDQVAKGPQLLAKLREALVEAKLPVP